MAVSCSSGSASETASTAETDETDIETTTETETTAAETEYAAPKTKDFSGYDFRIIADQDVDSNNTPYYYTEQLNGELINDTIYNRNILVEDEYNITVSFTKNDSPIKVVDKSVKAGDDVCDIACGGWNSQMFETAESGYLINYYDISSIDLSKPWWDQRIQDGYTINGKIYGMTGDFEMEDDLNELAVLYNISIANQYSIDDPVQTVLDGNWTMDYMKTQVEKVTADLNGDGVLDGNDQWGLTTESLAGWYFIVGSGDSSIINKNGKMSLNLDDAKLSAIFEKVMALLADKSITLCTDDGLLKDDIWNTTEKMFQNDQVLFRTGTFGDCTSFREMQSDFGVLPIPKYDDAQNEYYCMSHNVAKPAMIPITISDAERSGLILDALSYQSMLTLNPAFYETYLGDKILRDENAMKMLNILFSSKIYDIDFTMDISGLPGKVYKDIKKGTDTFSSDIASVSDKAEAALKKFTSAFD